MKIFHQSLKILCIVLVMIVLPEQLFAQNKGFTGTYTFQNGAFTLQLKPVGSEYHGTLQGSGVILALKGIAENDRLNGTVYSDYGNYSFNASRSGKNLMVSFQGNSYNYYQVSEDHQLAGVDLTPYFKGDDQADQQGYNNELYTKHIAGSQLVFYQRTSYVLDNDVSGSSITYVNFCPDGRFSINYEGSFTVQGSTGGNASGASYGSNFGQWKVINSQNSPAVQLNFANGQQGIYPFHPQQLYTGRWKIGNTQYALAKDKVVCN